MRPEDGNEIERSWLAAIVESSDDAIIGKDLQGSVFAWNKAAERLFGFTAEEMIGGPITRIFPSERLDEEFVILERIGRGERIEHFETERVHRDGRTMRVSVTTSGLRDRAGRIIGASTIMRDLSERHLQALRLQELQSQLAHIQRLNELGQFVSALVHEVNQPLTAMTNYVRACERLLSAGNVKGAELALKRIGEQTLRTTEIVQRIRNFVRKRELQVEAEPLVKVAEDAVTLMRTSLRGEAVPVELQIGTDTSVEIDRIQIQQVLFNLVRNGIEAMRDSPNRRIVIAAQEVAEGMVEVAVSDSGPGLSDVVRTTLFQPFVTTKSEGMGVGLSVCRTIVEAHGGRLWVDDPSETGTTFRFTLRRAPSC
jgi:two-component system sensor kinase FixL